jgi:hypothetical protein
LNLKHYSNEELSILNQSINPGETKIINLGFIYHELMHNWNLAQANQPPLKISPLD